MRGWRPGPPSLPLHRSCRGDRNLAGGTGLVAGAGQRSVTEGFRPVAPPVGVPMVDDHLHRHGTAPDTAFAVGIVGRHRQASMSALAVDGQRWRHSMPRCRGCQFFSTPHQFQLADFIDVGGFESRIRTPDVPAPRRGHRFGVGVWRAFRSQYRLEIQQKLRRLFPRPAQVTQIGMALFIEGTGQANSRLDRSDSPKPGNLGVHPQFVPVFKVRRSGIRRQWAFDINLHNVDAIGRRGDSQGPLGRMSPAVYILHVLNASIVVVVVLEVAQFGLQVPGASRTASDSKHSRRMVPINRSTKGWESGT